MVHINKVTHYLNTKGIRITVADVSSAAIHLQKIHKLPELTGAIMGKVLAGTATLATDFKNHEGISLQWRTSSKLGTLYADVYESGYVRGYPEYIIDQDVKNTIKNEKELVSAPGSKITVTRYSLLKMPYNSTIMLQNGDVSDCLTQYLSESDQTRAIVKTETQINQAGNLVRAAAYMAELLPEGNSELFHLLFENNEYFLFDKFAGKSLLTLLENSEFRELFQTSIVFRCTCSEDRIKNTLLSLPKVEKEKLLEQETTEISCHYCGQLYKIPRSKLKNWFSQKGGYSHE